MTFREITSDMTVSEAILVGETLCSAANEERRKLRGREAALVVLAQRVRELNVQTGVQR